MRFLFCFQSTRIPSPIAPGCSMDRVVRSASRAFFAVMAPLNRTSYELTGSWLIGHCSLVKGKYHELTGSENNDHHDRLTIHSYRRTGGHTLLPHYEQQPNFSYHLAVTSWHQQVVHVYDNTSNDYHYNFDNNDHHNR